MHTSPGAIPIRLAKILIAFFVQTITADEKIQLNDWLKESETNRNILCDCVDIVEHRPKTFDPYQDRYEPMDFWILADYFIKCKKDTLSPAESRCLNEWLTFSDLNQMLFNMRTSCTNRREMFNWLIRADEEFRAGIRSMSNNQEQSPIPAS